MGINSRAIDEAPGQFAHLLTAFRQGLGQTGHVEHRISESNTGGAVAIARRSAAMLCPSLQRAAANSGCSAEHPSG